MHPYWRSIGINVPWTKGQRAWIKRKADEALKGIFHQRLFFSEQSKPTEIIMSADVFKAFQDAVANK